MASETLYRKYRPKNFSEIIGQKHIVQTLVNSIKNNRIGHAYLFTGPRGTGKTSIARILAKTINCANLVCEERAATKLSIRRSPAEADNRLNTCNACDKCNSCRTISDGRSLDIIEIDAASNTGVDNIRELRETVKLPPTSLKYKVYIIDEAHMLSQGAFNALLKTLEEPPAHVVFILATTEIHKVPETIISRCQRFDFTRLPIQNIIEKLSLIAKSEKVTIDKDSLEMIAISAEGGMRDAESLLGQIISLEDKNITAKEVAEVLGTADRKSAFEISEMIIANDSKGAIEKINSLVNDGYDLAVFNKSLLNYLRQLMLLKISPELKSNFSFELTAEQIEKMIKQSQKTELQKIISCINLFLDAQSKISAFMLPQLPLEIAIIKATRTFPQPDSHNSQPETKSATPIASHNPEHKLPTTEKKSELRVTSYELRKDPAEKTPLSNSVTPNENQKQILTYDVQSNWNKILEAIKPRNHSLQALLFSCQVVSVENNQIMLATPYSFYKDKLNEPANRLTVEEVFGKILGAKISIKTVTNDEAGIKQEMKSEKKEGNEPPKKQDSLLKDALSIFGGKIVKE